MNEMQIDKKLYELGSEYRSSEATAPIQVGVFHPAELRTSLRKYYKYTGSSSVPPCTEHLIYLVIAKVKIIHSISLFHVSNLYLSSFLYVIYSRDIYLNNK